MIGAALALGRRLAVSRMTETVQVGVFTDGVDPATGAPKRTLATSRYEGVGRVKYDSLTVSESSGAGSPVAKQTPFLSVPHGSTVLVEGDEVAVTASTVDEALVGRRYKVAGAPQSGQTTAHRYPLIELS